MAGSGISWDDRLRLKALNAKSLAVLAAAAGKTATDAQAYMRANASWQDQTGNARNGLNAKVVRRGNTVAVVCHHSVDYGIYLEVRWNGRYEIIRPTIQEFGPRFTQLFSSMLVGMR